MDQHPIPQDVTGFQFKLIGTMTVKQFGFVASGVVMAVILYYLPLNTPFSLMIKLLLIPMLGAGGVVIAFVPIDGRPIDVMATNFVKALFAPNQYLYQRQGRKLSFSKIADAKVTNTVQTAAQKQQATVQKPTSGDQSTQREEQLRALLLNSRDKVKNDLDKKEAAFLNTLAMPSAAPSSITPPRPAMPVAKPAPLMSTPQSTAMAPKLQPIPTSPVVKNPQPMAPQPNVQSPQKETSESLSNKEALLEQQLEQAKAEETKNTSPTGHAAAHEKVTDLEVQIKLIHDQKQQLEAELTKLKEQLTQQKNPTPEAATQAPTPAPAAAPAQMPQAAVTPVPVKPMPAQDPMHVRTIPQDITKKAGLPHVSDTPNVVVGIVKDPRGNVLPNILVEVKDKEGNPVRAFKTNALGQFASATPLSTGTYTMELEDPKKMHRFDIIQVTAENQIMLPIEVISHDAREELRQQLFAS